ncbi:MAG: adenylate/guanylate cyclase domain-containing protein [Fibrobacterota bacterium]
MKKAWHQRDGVQVVTDLAACKERELDFSMPIEVEGIPLDSQVSCRNTLSLISYVENSTGTPVSALLKGVGIDLPLSHIKDPHKWVSYEDSLRLFELARRLEATRNPRRFLWIGRHAHRWQTMGAGVDALANLLPLRRVMWIASEYGRVFNNGQFIRSIRQSNGQMTLISKYAEYVTPYRVLDMDWWTIGIYTGFPERRGLPAANARLEYSLFPIENLLDREYNWLGIRDHGVRSEWTYHGLARKRWFVEGEEYAPQVILLKESLRPGSSKQGEDLFAPTPHELEDFTPRELNDHLENRKACIVWLVTKTLERGKDMVVESGEIYGAPYTRFSLKWTERSWLEHFRESIRDWRKRMAISGEALRVEIEAAKAEAMTAERERAASERKSLIFQTYARRSLVDRIDRGEDPRQDKPVRQDLAILFADLRGFTQVASYMSPEDTVAFLNSYFTRLNRPIYHHRGEIDKIMGDGMMAVFNDGKGLEPMAVRAVQASIEIRLELQAYNRERWEWHTRNAEPGQDFPRIDNGIGIAFGPVVTGNIGSDHKLDHTLIGDVVNVASRLEGLTRYYGTAILITHEVRSLLPDRFCVRFLDTIKVKGREEPVGIYEIFDHEPTRVRDSKARNQARMEEAWELYAAGLFSEARHIYEELVRTSGPHMLETSRCMDPALEFFLARCKSLETRSAEDPTMLAHWVGIHGFDVK